MINDRKTRILILIHPGKDIKPGLIRAILKEAGLSREDFFNIPQNTFHLIRHGVNHYKS
jgi:hypothetical protein